MAETCLIEVEKKVRSDNRKLIKIEEYDYGSHKVIILGDAKTRGVRLAVAYMIPKK